MPSTLRSYRRGIAFRIVAGAIGVAWIVFLYIMGFSGEQEPGESPTASPDVTIRQIESYDSDDLRDVRDELQRLRGTRLTPEERAVVSDAAAIVDSIISGDAVIAPEPSTSTSTTSPPATTTTTTTEPPPTTTAPPADAAPSTDDYLGALSDQYGADRVDEPGEAG